MSDPTQREAIQRLLRRVDEVRGLESLPVGADFAEGEETARLLATAEGLILTKMLAFRPQDQADIETLLMHDGRRLPPPFRTEVSKFAAPRSRRAARHPRHTQRVGN